MHDNEVFLVGQEVLTQDKNKGWTIPAVVEGARVPKGLSVGDQVPRSYNIHVEDTGDEMLRGRRLIKARKLDKDEADFGSRKFAK